MTKLFSLNICGLDYSVISGQASEIPGLDMAEGLCIREKNTIYLREGMPDSRTRDALLHEIIHAYLEASGLGHLIQSNLRENVVYEDFEETLIRLIVPSLLRLVEDNNSALASILRPKPKKPRKRSRK